MSLLKTLQTQCADRLNALPFFAGAPGAGEKAISVLTENRRDLVSRINQLVNSFGIFGLVVTPTAKVSHPDVPGPELDEIRLVVRVQENVTINRAAGGSGQPASLVAEAAAQALHLWQPDAESGASELRCESIGLVEHETLLVYDVVFLTSAVIDPEPSIVRVPPAAAGVPANP